VEKYEGKITLLMIISFADDVMFLPLYVCLTVCPQDNSKSCFQVLTEFLEG